MPQQTCPAEYSAVNQTNNVVTDIALKQRLSSAGRHNEHVSPLAKYQHNAMIKQVTGFNIGGISSQSSAKTPQEMLSRPGQGFMQ